MMTTNDDDEIYKMHVEIITKYFTRQFKHLSTARVAEKEFETRKENEKEIEVKTMRLLLFSTAFWARYCKW